MNMNIISDIHISKISAIKKNYPHIQEIVFRWKSNK